MSDSSPPASPSDAGAPPPPSPMSSLRALMSRRDLVRNRSTFEGDNDSGSANIVSIVADPPVDPILQRLQAIKRQRLLSADSLRDYEEFEKV